MKGTVRQTAASVIPFYSFLEDQIVPVLLSKSHKDLGKKTDATAVDQGEINTSFSTINAELGGTLNPIKFAINLLKRLFGNSKQERIQGELGQLRQYSGLYDNYLFANDSLKFLKTKLRQQVSKTEGLVSKVGLLKNKKVMADPVLNELKSTFKSWLIPFEQILSGGVKGVSLYKADIDFLQSLASDLQNGSHAEYLKDLSNDVNRVIGKIVKEQQKTTQSSTQQSPNTALARSPQASRQAGQQLASLAA